MAEIQPRPHETESSSRKPPENLGSRDLWKYAGLGTQLTATVLLFAALGWWLDQHFVWSPWGVLIGGILGVAAALYHFLKEVL